MEITRFFFRNIIKTFHFLTVTPIITIHGDKLKITSETRHQTPWILLRYLAELMRSVFVYF